MLKFCVVLYLFSYVAHFSSLGQNLKTSTYVWEIIFAISISIIGLVLFSLLIGNMQVLLDFHFPLKYLLLVRILYGTFNKQYCTVLDA